MLLENEAVVTVELGRPAASARRPSVWAALGNALLTLVGVYRY